MCNMCNFWYWPLFSEEESLPDKKKRTSDKPAQVRRCAQGHERRFQLGEGENKSWRFDFFFYQLPESNLCLLFNMIFCSGERSRTQAELAALREARSTQMEELDPLYSTRQVQRKIVSNVVKMLSQGVGGEGQAATWAWGAPGRTQRIQREIDLIDTWQTLIWKSHFDIHMRSMR